MDDAPDNTSPVSEASMDTTSAPKILLLYWGRRGGGCRYALEMARSLDRRNDVELHLSLSKYNSRLDDFLALNIPSHLVSTYTSVPSFLAALVRVPGMLIRLRKYIIENRISCVYSPMIHVWSSLIRFVVRRTGCRYLSTIHDPEPHVGEWPIIPPFLVRGDIDAADHVFCLSEYVATRINNIYGCPREKITVCAHGIFTFADDFQTDNDVRERAGDERPFRFLFFGRIYPYKGLGLLLEAFAALRAENINAELVIAGNGDVSEYAALLDTEGVTAEIRWINENEIPKFYGAADGVVLPYVSGSQSGVWADASAFNKPCVVTSVSGISSQITDGVNGIVADDVTPSGLLSAMKRIMDPAVYSHLVNNLRTRDRRGEWDQTAENIVKVL